MLIGFSPYRKWMCLACLINTNGMFTVRHKRPIIGLITYVLEKTFYGLKKVYLQLKKTIYGLKKTIYSFEVISVE